MPSRRIVIDFVDRYRELVARCNQIDRDFVATIDMVSSNGLLDLVLPPLYLHSTTDRWIYEFNEYINNYTPFEDWLEDTGPTYSAEWVNSQTNNYYQGLSSCHNLLEAEVAFLAWEFNRLGFNIIFEQVDNFKMGPLNVNAIFKNGGYLIVVDF